MEAGSEALRSPAAAFDARAASIAAGMAWLLDNTHEWVHRVWEELELSDAAVLRRRTHMDVTVPSQRAQDLAYRPSEKQAAAEKQTAAGDDDVPGKDWYVVPLGFAAKPADARTDGRAGQPRGALRRFVLESPEGLLLASHDTGRLLCHLVARKASVSDSRIPAFVDKLDTLANQTPTAATGALATRLGVLKDAYGADVAAITPMIEHVLCRLTLLAIVVRVQPGVPVRLTWSQDIVLPERARAAARPVIYRVRSPGASQPGGSCYVTVSAPEHMVVEALAIVGPDSLCCGQDQLPAATATAYLPSRDKRRLGDREVRVAWGLEKSDLRATALGLSTLVVVVLCTAFAYRGELSQSTGSLLIAAPGLVLGAVTGFAGGRAARHFASRLRLCTVLVALMAVLGGITIAAHGQTDAGLEHRTAALATFGLLALALTAVPGFAFFRPHASVEMLTRDAHGEALDDGPEPLAPLAELAEYLAQRKGA